MGEPVRGLAPLFCYQALIFTILPSLRFFAYSAVAVNRTSDDELRAVSHES